MCSMKSNVEEKGLEAGKQGNSLLKSVSHQEGELRLE